MSEVKIKPFTNLDDLDNLDDIDNMSEEEKQHCYNELWEKVMGAPKNEKKANLIPNY